MQMLKKLFLLELVFATVVVIPAAAVIFEDCGSAYDLRTVNIEGCGWSLPCYVTLGEETPVRLEFYADFTSSLLDQNVVINVNLVYINADVTPDNCVTDDCLVQTGAVNHFTSVMSVPKLMALNQRGYLNWRVYNERKRLVICYSVLVQTQSTTQKKLRHLLSKISPEHANNIVDNLDPEALESSLNIESDASYDELNRNFLQELVDQYFAQTSTAKLDQELELIAEK